MMIMMLVFQVCKKHICEDDVMTKPPWLPRVLNVMDINKRKPNPIMALFLSVDVVKYVPHGFSVAAMNI